MNGGETNEVNNAPTTDAQKAQAAEGFKALEGDQPEELKNSPKASPDEFDYKAGDTITAAINAAAYLRTKPKFAKNATAYTQSLRDAISQIWKSQSDKLKNIQHKKTIDKKDLDNQVISDGTIPYEEGDVKIIISSTISPKKHKIKIEA